MPRYLDERHDLENLAVASALDEVAFWASRFAAFMLDSVPLRPNLVILDVGCGTGVPLFELAQRGGAGCRVAGVDLWGAGLARAARKQAVYRLDNVAFARADAAALPFRDHAFDLIVSNLGQNNWSDQAAVLADCARVAKPGATIALTSNLIGHYAEFYDVYHELLAEQGAADSLERLARNVAHRGSPETVRGLLERAGFRVTRVLEQRFQSRFVDGSALLNHMLTKIGFLDGWRGAVAAADQPRIFAELERRLNHRAAAEGCLTLTVPALYVEAVRA